MDEARTISTSPRAHRGEFAEALALLERVVADGLGHGFFDCSITCKIVNGGKRELVIRAGTAINSLSRGGSAALTRREIGDPWDGDAKMQVTSGPALSVGFRGRRPEARSGEKPAVRSSVKPSQAENDNLINHTCQVWQRRLGRNLSREDARQIIKNFTGLFNVLTEWAEASTPANDDSFRGEVRHDRLQPRHSKTALCPLPSAPKGGAA